MPTLPITVPNVFANATSNIALSLLDADFLAVSQAINGIGNGSTPLTNVTITGGTLTNTTLNNPAISGGSMTGTNLSNVSITGAAVLTQNGQCRLVYNNANQIILHPYNGQAIQIAGMIYAIPANGVSLTNAGMIANTLYYIYAFVSGGAVTLEFSPIGHEADTHDAGNYGVEVKSTDQTRSLVGMIKTTNAGGFSDTPTFRGVASWFNRRNVTGVVSATVTGFSTSGAYVTLPIGSVIALVWGDEHLSVSAPLLAASAAAIEPVSCGIQINGASGGTTGSTLAPLGQFTTTIATLNGPIAENAYTVTLVVSTPTTDSKSISGTINTLTRQ